MFTLQDYAMLLSTLEENVHMAMNTDENHWWLILGVIVLILLMVILALGKANSNRFVLLTISTFFYLDTFARLLMIVLQNIINFT